MSASSKKTLIIETANHQGCFGLLENDRLVNKIALEPGQQATAHLPALLKKHIDFTALDQIAVCNGPGSFTGIRVGLSLAQGLAFVKQLPIIPIPALQALAFYHKIRNVTIEAIGAGYFTQEFEADCQTPKTSVEHTIDTIDKLQELPSIEALANLAPHLKPTRQLSPLYVKPCYATKKP